jgi:hypothetical protein
MFTPSVLKDLRDDINAALESVGAKYNVKLTAGNVSYTADNATFKLQAASISESGDVLTKEASDFKVFAASYGLKPEDLGKPFTTGTGTYTIVGLRSRSYKMPIIGKNSNGKMFKFSPQAVKFGLEMANRHP